MKIHTNTLTCASFTSAAANVTAHTRAVVDIDGPHHRGSRTHARAFEVKLTGDGTQSRRRVNYGTSQAWDRFDRPYAATYDQWGWFLAHLFDVDPDAMIPRVYANAEDFHRKTAGKYRATATV